MTKLSDRVVELLKQQADLIARLEEINKSLLQEEAPPWKDETEESDPYAFMKTPPDWEDSVEFEIPGYNHRDSYDEPPKPKKKYTPPTKLYKGMSEKDIRKCILGHGFSITRTEAGNGSYQYRHILNNGSMVVVYETGTILIQGKEATITKQILT